MIVYGVSTGESGNYGCGDIVEGDSFIEKDGEFFIDNEQVFNVFNVVNGKIVYLK